MTSDVRGEGADGAEGGQKSVKVTGVKQKSTNLTGDKKSSKAIDKKPELDLGGDEKSALEEIYTANAGGHPNITGVKSGGLPSFVTETDSILSSTYDPVGSQDGASAEKKTSPNISGEKKSPEVSSGKEKSLQSGSGSTSSNKAYGLPHRAGGPRVDPSDGSFSFNKSGSSPAQAGGSRVNTNSASTSSNKTDGLPTRDDVPSAAPPDDTTSSYHDTLNVSRSPHCLYRTQLTRGYSLTHSGPCRTKLVLTW